MAGTLAGAPGALWAQSSPDTQQETKQSSDSKPQSPPDTGQAQSGQSPDIQQEKNGNTKKKSKTNAHQAHGTPKPKNDTTATATSH